LKSTDHFLLQSSVFAADYMLAPVDTNVHDIHCIKEVESRVTLVGKMLNDQFL